VHLRKVADGPSTYLEGIVIDITLPDLLHRSR
jgi:hypothetical protein